MTDATDLEQPSTQTNDRQILSVGDHVHDLENLAQAPLVAERTPIPAHDYIVGETSTTVVDIHPEYDSDDEIFPIAHPQPPITDLLTYPVSCARLDPITLLPGGADR
ncbi:hypothetical protein QA600_21125 [Natronococcus sp. A-GB1]|uniref:hypothetical protein n=1 Tax=Natronococcus sp. A-GB1 TaxID=3037648 RepID=UPI00241E041C|nr:hypothetical protein [Natronococcus sp. A-GB1]MDG5761829.1 hypothetical protein [Natronococcus sp. A-GB1]